MITKWFNFYGLIFIAVIMIPNIIFAITNKDGFQNLYKNKSIEIFEQIGRIGCFVFMILHIPPLVKGFWFDRAEIVYVIFGCLFVLIYVAGWIIFRHENSVRKSLFLSCVPSLLFIVSGALLGNIPLVVASVIFAPCHILISYKNAKLDL